MAEPIEVKKFASIGEKYEALTKGKQPSNSLVWLTNNEMNALPAHRENPVLIQVAAKDFARPKNPYLKQGYTQYKHVKAAPAPVEARPVMTTVPASKTVDASMLKTDAKPENAVPAKI